MNEYQDYGVSTGEMAKITQAVYSHWTRLVDQWADSSNCFSAIGRASVPKILMQELP